MWRPGIKARRESCLLPACRAPDYVTGRPWWMGLSGTRLYWTTLHGDWTYTLLFRDVSSDLPAVQVLKYDGLGSFRERNGFIYFVARRSLEPDEIRRARLDASGHASASQVLVKQAQDPEQLAVTSKEVVWAGGWGVFAVPLSGGVPRTIKALRADLLVVRGDRLYFTGDKGVFVADGQAAPRRLASVPGVRALVVHGEQVYFASDKGVFVSDGGGPARGLLALAGVFAIFVRDRRLVFACGGENPGLAVARRDGSALHYLYQGPLGAVRVTDADAFMTVQDGTLRRVRLRDGAMQLLAHSGDVSAYSLSLGKQFLYLEDSDRIGRVPLAQIASR